MTQTRAASFVEAWANIAVGFGINWAANMLVLPLFGFHVTGAQAFGIGVIFTAISLVRSYVLRRWFNGMRWGNKREADKEKLQRLIVETTVQSVRRDIESNGPVAQAMRDRLGIAPRGNARGMEHAP